MEKPQYIPEICPHCGATLQLAGEVIYCGNCCYGRKITEEP